MKIQHFNCKFFAIVFFMSAFTFSCQSDLEETQEEIVSADLVTNTTRNTNLEDRFQYFHRGNSRDNIYTSHSESGIGSWSSNTRINGLGLTKSTVKATQFGSEIAVAYVGRRNTKKIYYGLSSDGDSFGPERVVPGAQTSGTFSMIEFDDDLFVYHRGRTSGNSRMFYSALDGANNTWSQNSELANSPIYNDFDFVVANGLLFMVVINSSRIIVKTSTNGVNFNNLTSQLFQLPTGTGFPTSLSITQNPYTNSGTIDYHVVIGTSTGHVLTTVTSNFTTFSPVTKIRINNSDVKSAHDVSIASNGSRLVIAYEKESGNSIRYAYSNDGNNWIGNINARGGTSRSGVDIIYTE